MITTPAIANIIILVNLIVACVIGVLVGFVLGLILRLHWGIKEFAKDLAAAAGSYLFLCIVVVISVYTQRPIELGEWVIFASAALCVLARQLLRKWRARNASKTAADPSLHSG